MLTGLRSTSVPRSNVAALSQQYQQQSPAPISKSSSASSNKNFDTYNNAFEDEIACNMDALDNLQDPPPTVAGLASIFDTQNNRHTRGGSQEDASELYDSWRGGRNEGLYGGDGGVAAESWRGGRGGSGGGRRGLDSDEVRIMTKVLGGVSSDKNDCLAALNITDWNIHKVSCYIKNKVPRYPKYLFTKLTKNNFKQHP